MSLDGEPASKSSEHISSTPIANQNVHAPDKPRPVPDQSVDSRNQLHQLASETVIGREGQYTIVETADGIKGIRSPDGKPVARVHDSTEYTVDNRKVIVARTNTPSSGATLPEGTSLLMLGEPFFAALEDPALEQVAGYMPGESLKMIVGHELTHLRFHALPTSRRQEITKVVGAQWGKVYPFVERILRDEKYLKAIQKQATLDSTMRPVKIGSETVQVPVEAITDELVAYYSASKIVDRSRFEEIVAQDDSASHLREELALLSEDIISGIEQLGELTSGLYTDVAAHSSNIVQEARGLKK